MSDRTPTSARPTSRKDSHWYSQTGEPCYEIMGKTTGRPRPVNITDARKQGLVPSVTTILKCLHKEALVNWMIEQACLAVLTTPRPAEEPIDAFVERVLHHERVQDQESKIARDKGTDIHNALEALFTGQNVQPDLLPWIMPATLKVQEHGKTVETEKILVGDGYAGKTDLILEAPECWWLFDFKSTKNLPTKGAYPEARLQLSAYAKAWEVSSMDVRETVRTANVYISTVDCGQFVICEHENWQGAFKAFEHLLAYWKWANNFQSV